MSGSAAKCGVVVAGYDGSGGAGLATLWAAAEAASQGHRLIVVYAAGWPPLPEPPLPPPVWPTPLGRVAADPTTLRRAETLLAAIAGESRRLWPSLPVRTRIVFGHPVQALCQAAAEAYLLAIGPPAPNGPRRTLLGSTAAQLVHRCDRPIVVVRHITDRRQAPTPADGGRVVVGIADPTTGTRATEFAYDYAARHDCELVAVHAWPHPAPQAPAPLDDVRRDWHTEWEQAEWFLAQVLADYTPRYPDVPVHRVVTHDRPARALRQHAHGATLLVIGHHQRGPHRALPGSVSNALIHRPPCPVAVLRDEPHNNTSTTVP